MAQQTINVGTSPNDGTGTPLRTAFQYTNSNFSELYTALGGGTGLPGATTQVIFNDGGTNLAGDAGLVYNKTTDALTIGGNVQAASATITGDLTVDTSTLKVDSANNRVGIGTVSPATDLHIQSAGTASAEVRLAAAGGRSYNIGSTASGYGSANNLIIYDITGSAERWRLDGNGNHFWNNVGGVAGTAMTLNSTGLGVGASPSSYKLTVAGTGYFGSTLTLDGASRLSAAGTNALNLNTNSVDRVTIDSAGNVGVGVTPSANRFQVAGNIGLPNSCTASGETSGVFSIDVANLLALTGANWRQCSLLLVYSGVDTGLGNSTVLQTVVTLQGLSTYGTISKNDIVGTASVAVSNDTASGARITVTVPTGNAGSVYVMLLGGAGSTTRPSITINA